MGLFEGRQTPAEPEVPATLIPSLAPHRSGGPQPPRDVRGCHSCISGPLPQVRPLYKLLETWSSLLFIQILARAKEKDQRPSQLGGDIRLQKSSWGSGNQLPNFLSGAVCPSGGTLRLCCQTDLHECDLSPTSYQLGDTVPLLASKRLSLLLC